MIFDVAEIMKEGTWEGPYRVLDGDGMEIDPRTDRIMRADTETGAADIQCLNDGQVIIEGDHIKTIAVKYKPPLTIIPING